MKRKLFSVLLLMLVALIQPACKKNSDPAGSQDEVMNKTLLQVKNTASDLCPGIYSGIAVDMSGNAWYTTVRADTTVYVPPASSYFPTYTQIYMYNGKSHCLKYDNIKNTFEKLAFDHDGNLWLMGSKKIAMINKQHQLSELLALKDNQGLFQTIEVDCQNNIWVAGLGTGLYKFSGGQWTNYNASNSPLKTNSITQIHADMDNALWLALWDLMGVQKIENNKWTSFTGLNSKIYLRDIWDLKTDRNGNLWVGSGWIDPAQTLLKFDGSNWLVSNPHYSSGNDIPGTIRRIQIDMNGNIWTVSEEVKNNVAVKTTLSLYKAPNWSVIENAAGNKIIRDIKSFNNKIYLSTEDKIYIMDL